MNTKRWVSLVVLGAVLCIVTGCPPQSATVGPSQAEFASLKERVDDIEWWFRGDKAPVDKTQVHETFDDYINRLHDTVCKLEDEVGIPESEQMCPTGGGGPGDPPPSPPFL